MLASVKLNQMVRPSGHRATSNSTISMGARNSQAVRVLLFMERMFQRKKSAASEWPAAGRWAQSDYQALRLICLSLPSSFFRLSSALALPESTSEVAFQKAALTSGYFRPVAVAGRGTALVKTL